MNAWPVPPRSRQDRSGDSVRDDPPLKPLFADRLQQLLRGQPHRVVADPEQVFLQIRLDRLDPGKP